MRLLPRARLPGMVSGCRVRHAVTRVTLSMQSVSRRVLRVGERARSHAGLGGGDRRSAKDDRGVEHHQARGLYVRARHVVSCRVVSRRIVSCRVVSCRVVSYRVASRHVTSRHVTSRHVTSCHTASSQLVEWHCVSCQIMSCYGMAYRIVIVWSSIAYRVT